jgi:hypothetical protein
VPVQGYAQINRSLLYNRLALQVTNDMCCIVVLSRDEPKSGTGVRFRPDFGDPAKIRFGRILPTNPAMF